MHKETLSGIKLNPSAAAVKVRNFSFVFSFNAFTSNAVKLKGFTVNELSKIEDNYLDFVYVDAGHEYHDVKNDLEVSYKKVKNGGIIMGHDYNKDTFAGLCLAVDEFCEKYGLNIKYLTKDGCPTYLIELNK